VGQQAGIQLFNSRSSCTLDMSCGVTRVVGISELGGANGRRKTRIAIPNPGMNRIWTQLLFRGGGYGVYPVGRLTKIETWEDRQGITVTLPFKPNNKPDPDFPHEPYDENYIGRNPRAIVYGFY